MKVFNNTDTPFYDQLISMGPQWLAEYWEMDANYQFASWTLELMLYFLNQLINNEFPATCDEEHLSMYEEILNIEYTGDPELEERRNTVGAYWSGFGKISKTSIESLLTSYTGKPTTVSWKDLSTSPYLEIRVGAAEGDSIKISRVLGLAARALPAHIDCRMACMYSIPVKIIPSVVIYGVAYTFCGNERFCGEDL